MTPAIVVIAYDRPHTLQRLLASLDAADYPAGADVQLVISVDQGPSSGRRSVLELANRFEWRFGPKRVIEQPEHLGVVGHFRASGGLSGEYGAVILLEDDLTVAPPFHAFAAQVLARYDEEDRVGGVCLYDLWFNGFTQLPFRSLDDGNDVYFVQLPYTQGCAFTASQWSRFEAWWERNPGVEADVALHPGFLRFGEEEWFPALAFYLAREGRYFCFPRSAVSTGWGDAGVHFDARTDWLLAPVQVRGDDYRLPDFDASLAVYDSFFEASAQRLRALAPPLPEAEFDVDLNATKTRANLRHEHVLTTRPARRALARFGLRLQPLELNVIQAVPGNEISMAQIDDVYWDRWGSLEARRRLEAAAWSKRRPSRRRAVAYGVARTVDRLRRLFLTKA
jgi:hypothetical protein